MVSGVEEDRIQNRRQIFQSSSYLLSVFYPDAISSTRVFFKMPAIEAFAQFECEETQWLAELRDRILSKLDISPKYESKLNEDKFLLRYIRKYNGDLDRSEKAVVNYMKLNEELHEQSCSREYPKEILDLCHGLIGGIDSENRVCMVMPKAGEGSKHFLDKADDATLKLLMECGMKTVITAEKQLDERNAESAVIILDLGSIPYAQYFHKKTLEFMLNLAQAVTRHLPVFVGKVILVNAPWPVKGFLKVLLSFVQIPADIIVCSPKPAHWKKELREHISESALPIEVGGDLTNSVPIGRLRDSLFHSK